MSLFYVVGAYSQSNGVEVIRQDVAEYIKNRDGGIASDPDHIVLSGGASESIRVQFWLENVKPHFILLVLEPDETVYCTERRQQASRGYGAYPAVSVIFCISCRIWPVSGILVF